MKRHPHRKKHPRLRVGRRSPPGTPPGTVVADPASPPPKLRVMAYGPDELKEQDLDKPSDILDFLGKWPVTWLNVDGLGDASVITELGKIFHLHPLALEDVVNRHQRAKADDYGDNYFIVTHMVSIGEFVETEQVSLFLGANFVVTLQDGLPGDSLDPVRTRIRDARGRFRGLGADYLAYSLLDAIIDGYFPVLERCGDRIEQVEEAILEQPVASAVHRLHELKRDLLVLRRVAWPLREAVHSLIRDATPLIRDDTRLYLRDCYDHGVRIMDLIEVYRELCADLMDLHLSSVSNRTNEIMKVLTVISVIFNPLTFLAGIWGMNFDPDSSPLNMPELHWYWGYPFALSLMAIVAGALLLYFARRGWLGPAAKSELRPSTIESSQ